MRKSQSQSRLAMHGVDKLAAFISTAITSKDPIKVFIPSAASLVRVEGWYYPAPLSVRSERKAFRLTRLPIQLGIAFCSCVDNHGMTHVELSDY